MDILANPNLSGPDLTDPCCWPAPNPFASYNILYTLWAGTDDEFVTEFDPGSFVVFMPESARPSITVGGRSYTLQTYKGAGIWFYSSSFALESEHPANEGSMYSKPFALIRWALDDWNADISSVPYVLAGAVVFEWDPATNALTLYLTESYSDPSAGESVTYSFTPFTATDDWSSRLELPSATGGLLAFRGRLDDAAGPLPAHFIGTSPPVPTPIYEYFPRPFALGHTNHRLTSPDRVQLSSTDHGSKSYFTFDGQQIFGWVYVPGWSYTTTIGTLRWKVSFMGYNTTTKVLTAYAQKFELIGGIWEPVYSLGYKTDYEWDPQAELSVDASGQLTGSATYISDPYDPDAIPLTWTAASTAGPQVEVRVLPPKWVSYQQAHQYVPEGGFAFVTDYSRPFVRPTEIEVLVSGLVWREGYQGTLNASFKLRWPDSSNEIEVGNVLLVASALDDNDEEVLSFFEYNGKAFLEVNGSHFAIGTGGLENIFLGSLAYNGTGTGIGDLLSMPGDSVTLSNQWTDFSGSNIAHSGEVTLAVS